MIFFFFLIFRPLKNVATYILIIVLSCVIRSGESFICDTCTCTNSIINCTENELSDILDLCDHLDVVRNATLMNFSYNSIVHVKQLPPSEVKYLSFRHNRINAIDDYAFAYLTFLVELDLSYNCLTTENLNSNIFKAFV